MVAGGDRVIVGSQLDTSLAGLEMRMLCRNRGYADKSVGRPQLRRRTGPDRAAEQTALTGNRVPWRIVEAMPGSSDRDLVRQGRDL